MKVQLNSLALALDEGLCVCVCVCVGVAVASGLQKQSGDPSFSSELIHIDCLAKSLMGTALN